MTDNREIKTLFDDIRGGSRVALARGITLIESQKEENFRKAGQLLDLCIPFTGNARRIGVTGSPGVGKSTFIEAFGLMRIETGKRIAVLTIDPSSTISGGAILGDKTRMARLSKHEHAFIRPTAAGGSLGGVAQKTREAMLLCEAAGYNDIIIETVGVGQSETQVARMVDYFILLLLPGAGDELQGMKRGIMELADLLVIHKADKERLKLAKASKAEYQRALQVLKDPERPLPVNVLLISSLYNEGFEELLAETDRFFAESAKTDYLYNQRAGQALHWFDELAQQRFQQVLFSHRRVKELHAGLRKAVSSRTKSVTLAIQELEQCLKETFGDS